MEEMKSMLSRTFLLCMLIGFLGSCGGDTSNDQASAENQVVKVMNKPKGKAKSRLIGPNKLTPTKLPTDYRVTVINKQEVKEKEGPIKVSGKNLTVAGWAIDRPAELPALGVYVMVDKKHFPATYGQERKGLSNLMGQKFSKSGFETTIALNKLSKGLHTINVKVVSRDGKSFHKVNPEKGVQILVE